MSVTFNPTHPLTQAALVRQTRPARTQSVGPLTRPTNTRPTKQKLPLKQLIPPGTSTPKAPLSKTATRQQLSIHRVPIHNRIRILLVHIPWFSIRGQARLAADVGVSRSTISRLVGGRINPSYRLARGVTDALERQLGRPLDMREVFTTDGTYPTPSGCALCQCKGCLPDQAYDPEGNLRSEWQGQRPGDWSLTPPAIKSDVIKSDVINLNAANSRSITFDAVGRKESQ